MDGIPKAGAGRRIGLLGGSFDPAHEGHVHISKVALRRFRLDEVWWLVTPGNPLKTRGPAPLERRMAAAEALAPRRVVVTDLEAHIGARFTADTIATLKRRRPGARFVWLMGADNLIQFHHWDRWEEIARSVPVGVLARPGMQVKAGLSPAARRLRRWRLKRRDHGRLAMAKAPAWALVTTGATSGQSSTAIRAAGGWP